MPIFKLSAPETLHLLSGHILPRSESNFTYNCLDFKKKFLERNPCLQGQERERERIGRDFRVHTSKGSAEGKDMGGQ